ncbi:lipoprotein [Spiroplasma corruscae]|nr:lipoprotein [Spiroplasma corruscae]
MKKLLGILAATGLVATTGATVVSCGNDTKETTKTDLSKISTKELGDISGEGITPSLSDLVKAINLKNDKLSLTDNDVTLNEGATTEKATITAKEESTKFTGSVEVTYKYTKSEAVEKKDLKDLEVKELGDISGEGVTPSLSDLVKAINLKNDKLSLTDNDVTLNEGATTEKATITAKEESTKFTGSVEVTYKYTKSDTVEK